MSFTEKDREYSEKRMVLDARLDLFKRLQELGAPATIKERERLLIWKAVEALVNE